MSNPVYCKIYITIPKSWAPEADTDQGDAFYTPTLNGVPWFIDDIWEALYECPAFDIASNGDRWTLELSGHLNYGACAIRDTLQQMGALGVPYHISEESDGETDAMWTMHNGYQLQTGLECWNQGAVLTKQEIDMIHAGQHWAENIDAYFAFEDQNLNELPLDHLAAVCPTREHAEQLVIDNTPPPPTDPF